jgi:hypothetical protein
VLAVLLARVVDCLNCQPLSTGILVRGAMVSGGDEKGGTK